VFVPPWSGLGPGPYELSLAQVRSGHDVTVITRYVHGCEAVDSGVPFEIYRIKTNHDLTFSVLAAMRFFSLHLENRFDVIHNHGPSAIALLLLRKLLFVRLPIVSSVHIVRKVQYKALMRAQIHRKMARYMDHKESEEMAPYAYDRKGLVYEKLYFSLSDALAPVSEGLSEEIKREYGISARVYPVFNGVNLSSFGHGRGNKKNATQIKTLIGCGKLLLFVGGLNGRKGEFDLIEAMQKVASEDGDIRLLIIGSGTAKKVAVRAVRKLSLEGHIQFVENMPHEELQKYYSASDLFVLPSYSEGLPKVLLEAMVAETPAVVSDIAAHVGIVENGVTGYLFQAGNPDSLASVMVNALRDDEKRENIIRNAKSMVEEKYTWQAVTKRLDKVYEELLIPSV